ASALLRELRGVARVLIVCPVSLKAEWEDQITKFTDLTLRFVQGTKPARLACYETPAFFTIANYEQVMHDVADVNRRLRPDVVILDEAQRIKNWNTQTARAIKRLESRYAFLLTGTPIENRIDEIYSIIDYVDPQVFGPLFRFNRTFYELDAVLDDLDVRRARKAIVFSEWERMLELVRALAGEMNLGFAWHTGSVPQVKRREEIRRFKHDPGCRLFLSTDSGGLGLNLQAASVVINLDLP